MSWWDDANAAMTQFFYDTTTRPAPTDPKNVFGPAALSDPAKLAAASAAQNIKAVGGAPDQGVRDVYGSLLPYYESHPEAAQNNLRPDAQDSGGLLAGTPIMTGDWGLPKWPQLPNFPFDLADLATVLLVVAILVVWAVLK